MAWTSRRRHKIVWFVCDERLKTVKSFRGRDAAKRAYNLANHRLKAGKYATIYKHIYMKGSRYSCEYTMKNRL
jgi:hypothetical protein